MSRLLCLRLQEDELRREGKHYEMRSPEWVELNDSVVRYDRCDLETPWPVLFNSTIENMIDIRMSLERNIKLTSKYFKRKLSHLIILTNTDILS